MKEVFLLFTVAALLGLGVLITLQSGSGSPKTGRGLWVIIGNFSALFLRVAGYLVGLVVVQRAVGLPLPLHW